MHNLWFSDFVRYAHILSVAVGFGTAFLADIHVLGQLKNRITPDLASTLDRYHAIVWWALAGMWISGLVLIWLRTGFVLENFTPKLFSKLFVVSLLSTNAILIGKIAMPMLRRNVGRSLPDLSLLCQIPIAMIAGVSTTSWLLALALGVSKVLAQSDRAFFIEAMPLFYLTSLAVSVMMVFAIQDRRLQSA